MAAATPSARREPRRRRCSTHAGLPELDAQPSAARIRLAEGAARKVSASVRRACIPDTYAASRPNRDPGRILIPGDGAAGDQGPRIGVPARQWRLRDACGLSRLNDFLALWSQAHLPSCNRQVTSTSIHMERYSSVPRTLKGAAVGGFSDAVLCRR